MPRSAVFASCAHPISMTPLSAGARWVARRASREGLPVAASTDSRDTGNRISFAGLRAFAETRDSDTRTARAESRVQSISLDAVSVTPAPCPRVGRSRQSLANAPRRRAGRTPFEPKGARAGERPERAHDRARGFSWPVKSFTGNIGGRAKRISADRRFAQPSRATEGSNGVRPYSAPGAYRGT